MNIIGQDDLIKKIERVFNIFENSNSEIRPNFILTGPSGSGKSLTIESLAIKHEFNFLNINAAQLTKEGTSGNSLSKALAPLANMCHAQTICFVDEFDKLFISGNSNSDLAHETTVGVQNEFLKVLESKSTSVFGDYGKYKDVPTSDVLFIFAGAFNNEDNVTLDRLRDFGVKTEFLGRVGLVFNTSPLSLDSLLIILNNSPLLKTYLDLFSQARHEKVVKVIGDHITSTYKTNPIGARAINTLIHQYFINDGELGNIATSKVKFKEIKFEE